MKKLLSILLAACMLCVLFAGCAANEAAPSAPEESRSAAEAPSPAPAETPASPANDRRRPLKVFIDVAVGGIVEVNGHGPAADAVFFQTIVQNETGLTDVEYEVLPHDEEVRGSAVTRVRAELMAGGGPDVLILDAQGYSDRNMTGALFPIPEQAVANGYFLPLDSYLETSEKLNASQFSPGLLNAGKGEDGCQLLPITIRLPVTVYRSKDFPLTLSAETTFGDMLADETGFLPNAVAAGGSDYRVVPTDPIRYSFGQLIQPGSDELLITEEELFARAWDVLRQELRRKNGEFSDLPANFHDMLSTGILSIKKTDSSGKDIRKGIDKSNSVSFVPVYNDEGGATAIITCYAAINRNTVRPEDAFAILETLFSEEVMADSRGIACWFFSSADTFANRSLWQTPQGKAQSKFNESKLAACMELYNQITFARFDSALENEWSGLYNDLWAWLDGREEMTEEEWKAILKQNVHAAYSGMLMSLAES